MFAPSTSRSCRSIFGSSKNGATQIEPNQELEYNGASKGWLEAHAVFAVSAERRHEVPPVVIAIFFKKRPSIGVVTTPAPVTERGLSHYVCAAAAIQLIGIAKVALVALVVFRHRATFLKPCAPNEIASGVRRKPGNFRAGVAGLAIFREREGALVSVVVSVCGKLEPLVPVVTMSHRNVQTSAQFVPTEPRGH